MTAPAKSPTKTRAPKVPRPAAGGKARRSGEAAQPRFAPPPREAAATAPGGNSAGLGGPGGRGTGSGGGQGTGRDAGGSAQYAASQPERFAPPPRCGPVAAVPRIAAAKNRLERQASAAAHDLGLLLNAPVAAERTAPAAERLPSLAAERGGRHSAAGAALAADLTDARGSAGRTLPAAAKAPIEALYGADLSRLRIHTDERADRLSRGLSATAFAHSGELFFRRGAFQPGSDSGQQLLVHEIAHALQQGAGRRSEEPILPVAPSAAARERIFRAPCYIPGNMNSPYAALNDRAGVNIAANRGFIANQRADILMQNRTSVGTVNLTTAAVNNFRSDESGRAVVTKDALQFALAEVDHIVPEVAGGGNTTQNAQVLSSQENNTKRNTYPWTGPVSNTLWTGVRIYLPENTAPFNAGTRLAVNGQGNGARVVIPGGTNLPQNFVRGVNGETLQRGEIIPSGITVPQGFPIGTKQSLGGPLLAAETLAQSAVFQIANAGFFDRLPAGSIISLNDSNKLFNPTGVLGPGLGEATLTAPAPVLVGSTINYTLPIGFRLSQGDTLNAGINLVDEAPFAGRLGNSIQLPIDVTLTANLVQTAQSGNLGGNLSISFAAAVASGIAPDGYPPP